MEERGREYRRRQPEGTVLYETVRENLATLLAEAGELGRGLPRYVERDFAKHLECGVLVHGFAQVRCESCKDELLVAFSCKGRNHPAGGALSATRSGCQTGFVEVPADRWRRTSVLSGHLLAAMLAVAWLPSPSRLVRRVGWT